ncbi:sensor histidine kinase [Azospirillum rugosum]|uniref:histidine kinase n=1 Tax=Azospirillum rugosum TaxID=416170 RepID=A0ABS4SMW0_9PROT|nr:ATP-binding protein [Azospirillum rugosum]MBP2292720.1 two-component system C4-dicarboxylate transport sensor histidine kinase DctB [Azospirillum rugosum]MDQ0526256.1 two-component system C4-dicarboxylate transport sensor histidine kinase DctB [Azospirillum rugosum]
MLRIRPIERTFSNAAERAQTPPPDSRRFPGRPFAGLIAALAARPRRLLLLAFIVGMPLAAALAAGWTASVAHEALQEQGRARLALYEANLRAELERHAAVPMVIARDAEVAALLAAPTPERVERMNRKLEGFARALGALALYIMNPSGTTIAASNWNSTASFVGQNFAYRPYFRSAIERGEGHHFALGTTSFVPGYYTAQRVSAENRTEETPLGVVVLKVGFQTLEEAWSHGGEKVLVTDRDGIVFITNVPGWRYNALPQRLPVTLPTTPDPPTEGVPTLPWGFGGGADRIALRENGVEMRYLHLSEAVPGGDWTIHALTSLEPASTRAQQAGLLAATVVALAALAGYALAQRRVVLMERLSFQEETRTELERRVADATAELRAAENELTQAAKLAALGQMSAGIAHEINQPLAAIRSFADNAVVLLDRDRREAVRDNLAEIADLTDRMAAITRQLKGFARRASGTLGPVSAQAAVGQALALLESRLRRDSVEVETDLPDATVWVTGEDVRLQQVLVNLIGNAADAMRTVPNRAITVTLAPEGGEAVLSVRDVGTGIAEADLPRLFVPFFTTKEAGDGLGLGLSISHGIVEDFGGSLTAANHPDGGAVFTIRLKRTESPA